MPRRLRKAVLTTHVVSSVGWLGAVLAYLALDVAAVTSRDVQLVRAAYLAMELTVSYAIVPLALASVLIGIVNALGTPWGLFRHYWVLVKLLLTLFATTVLLLETQTISHQGGRSEVRRRSPRAARHAGPLRRRPPGAAHDHDPVGIPTAGPDPVRMA